MQPFDYVVPYDHAEASRWLASNDGSVRALQGGTDLIVRARSGSLGPKRVVDLKGLPGMREIRHDRDGGLVIGAACTMNQVARHPQVVAHYAILVQACNAVASYQLRNRATVGGNCCNASPAADTAPALYCLDAYAEIYGPGGLRSIPIAEFFLGPGRTALAAGEFLTALRLPSVTGESRAVFNKLGRTKLGDISIVTVAVTARAAGDGPVPIGPLDWRIALGAVGPTPLTAPAAAAALAADRSPAGIAAAAGLAAAAARPITDIRASAAYRSAMVRVLARRGIESVLAAFGEAAR